MAEYVEKAAFREHLDSIPPFTKGGQRDPEYDFAKTVFLSELAAYPAADVREVKHGKWIENKKKQTKVGDFVRRYWNCSECGIEICNTLPQFDLSAWHYCPNCGEKLEDENGETCD